MSGFVKLYRRVLDNPVFKSDAEAMAFAWLILRASWQEAEVRYKGQIVKLERGQLTVSARDMAKALEWSKSRVSRFLNTLRERDMIEYVGGTHANVINIRNYATFQSNKKTDGTPEGQSAGQERDSSGTQNKEGKELKEEKNNNYAFSGAVVRLTQADFNRWHKSYSNLDLTALLQTRDDWLRDQPEAERKNWFRSTSSWLAKKQQEASSAKAEKADPWANLEFNHA